MHDIIFENQQALGTEDLFVYAKAVNLNLEIFGSDIQKQELIDRIEGDFESGVRSGVNGTPSFYINGKKYDGDYEEKIFTQYLRSQLSGDLREPNGNVKSNAQWQSCKSDNVFKVMGATSVLGDPHIAKRVTIEINDEALSRNRDSIFA